MTETNIAKPSKMLPQDWDAYAYPRQDFTKEGAYRAYMGDGSLSGQIAIKYRPTHKHMMEAYAIAWDEFVRLIPKEERGDMIKAYTIRLEAKINPKAKAGHYDAATNIIDPWYQQRLAFAFAKWEGLISQFSQAVLPEGKIYPITYS